MTDCPQVGDEIRDGLLEARWSSSDKTVQKEVRQLLITYVFYIKVEQTKWRVRDVLSLREKHDNNTVMLEVTVPFNSVFILF